jgi:copper chaperone CopZ
MSDTYNPTETRVYAVQGMTCSHCAASVREEVSEIAGVSAADVELAAAKLTVSGQGFDDDGVPRRVAAARSTTMEAHAQHHHEHGHHEHGDHAGHEHHGMPTSGRALWNVSISATLHCLTGCALGEIAGMAIGTALGFSNLGTVVLAVALAFIFGYALTSLPLLRAGLGIAVVIPIALASDTFSIAVMELIDNAVMLVVPGAMESGLGSLLFLGALAFALSVAFVVAVPVNRWLIARGKGHTAVHDTGIHGGPSPRLVGTILAAAFVFGTGVLIAEALDEDSAGSVEAPHAALTTQVAR